MKPNKTFGLTDEARLKMCTGKNRWSDELSAIAGAYQSLERRNIPTGLYVYKCPACHGWHLTRNRQAGKKPIMPLAQTPNLEGTSPTVIESDP